MDEVRKQFEAWWQEYYGALAPQKLDCDLHYSGFDCFASYRAGRAAGFAEAREAAAKVCIDSAGYDGGIRKALDEILALEPK